MISKKFNLNGSSMGAGYWGEKPKKKPINKLDPNRIDENDETKESYKMNNMITSSRSDENIYSMNKLKRKAPIGSSKSDENDHSYLIKEKELQEKRKRRIPLFKNEQEPINFLAEPIKLVHHVEPIAKPPLDFNSIKKSLSNKVDPILLNPSNLTYRLEPPNQTYRIENEIIPKNNSNNKHFKTDNEAQSNGTDFIHRIKSEEKNLNKISDSPKIKLFETGNNNKKKSTPTRIDSTQIQGVEESEILNLNILPQNETNQNGEKIKKPEIINTKPKTSRKQDDNSTNETSQYPEKTPKPKTANKQDTSKTNEPTENLEKTLKPKTAHRQDENNTSSKTKESSQNPEKITNLKAAPKQDENNASSKTNEPIQNPDKTLKPKTAHRQDENSVSQKVNKPYQNLEKIPKSKTANKQNENKVPQETNEPSQNPEKFTNLKIAPKQDENNASSKTNEPIENSDKNLKPKTAHKQDENKIPSKINETTQNLSKIPKPKTAHRQDENNVPQKTYQEPSHNPDKITKPKTAHREKIDQKAEMNQNPKPKTPYKQEDHAPLIQSEIKNLSQKKSPGVNDDLIDQKKETKSVQKIKMNSSVHENQNDPINSPKNYKIIASPLKDNVTKSSGIEKPKRETKTAKKSNNESFPTKSGNKIVTKKITPDQQISNNNKEINTNSPDRSKLFQVNNNQQIPESVPKTSTPAPVLIQVSPIDNNDDQSPESVQTYEPKSATNIDMNSIHEDELVKEDLNSPFKIYSPNENNVDESSVKYEKLNNEIESSQLSVDSHIAVQNELSTSSLIQNKKKKSTHYFGDFMNTLKHKKDEIIEKRNKRTPEDRKKSHIKLINICSILLCVLCPLTGLLSIYYSRKAKKYFEMKDIENTKKILNRTEWMLISTVFIGTIFVIGILAFLAFYLNWVSF
jgi:hypothetical protein